MRSKRKINWRVRRRLNRKMVGWWKVWKRACEGSGGGSADLTHAQLEGASLLLQLLRNLPSANLVPHHPILTSQLPLLLLHLLTAKTHTRTRTRAHTHTKADNQPVLKWAEVTLALYTCSVSHAHTLSIQAMLNINNISEGTRHS